MTIALASGPMMRLNVDCTAFSHGLKEESEGPNRQSLFAHLR
jgi:hypothetical protein